MSRKVRVGLIGSGFISAIHAEALSRCAEAELFVAKPQLRSHAQGGVGDARTINVVRDVEDKKERQQAHGDVAARVLRNLRGGGGDRSRRIRSGQAHLRHNFGGA